MPQLLRLLSRRDTAGVSVATWWLTAVAGLTWVIHNVRHHEVVAAATNSWSVAVAAAILYRCYRDSARWSLRGGVTLLVVATTADAVVFLIAPDDLGWIAAAIGVVQFLPQAGTVLVGDRLSGVSLWTWCLAVVAAALWMTYGLLHSDLAIVVPPLVTGSVSLLIVIRLLTRRAGQKDLA